MVQAVLPPVVCPEVAVTLYQLPPKSENWLRSLCKRHSVKAVVGEGDSEGGIHSEYFTPAHILLLVRALQAGEALAVDVWPVPRWSAILHFFQLHAQGKWTSVTIDPWHTWASELKKEDRIRLGSPWPKSRQCRIEQDVVEECNSPVASLHRSRPLAHVNMPINLLQSGGP